MVTQLHTRMSTHSYAHPHLNPGFDVVSVTGPRVGGAGSIAISIAVVRQNRGIDRSLPVQHCQINVNALLRCIIYLRFYHILLLCQIMTSHLHTYITWTCMLVSHFRTQINEFIYFHVSRIWHECKFDLCLSFQSFSKFRNQKIQKKHLFLNIFHVFWRCQRIGIGIPASE